MDYLYYDKTKSIGFLSTKTEKQHCLTLYIILCRAFDASIYLLPNSHVYNGNLICTKNIKCVNRFLSNTL